MITTKQLKAINRRKRLAKARNMRKNNRVGFTNANAMLQDLK